MKLSLHLVWILALLQSASADYRPDVELSQNSKVHCGERVRNDRVKVVDIQPLLEDKWEAVAAVTKLFPEHGLESQVPIIVERVHWSGRVTRKALIRDAVRESAMRGCDLLIILDLELLEKIVIRPPSMDLKLPVSRVLILFGSQVKNSARPVIVNGTHR